MGGKGVKAKNIAGCQQTFEYKKFVDNVMGSNPGYLLNLLYFSIFLRCVFLQTEIPN